MLTVKRRSIGADFSMCVQPAFIIGTYNEDGTPNFAPITWISVTYERENSYLLVISMFGSKRTKENIKRAGMLSANLVSRDMLRLMDYFGAHHGKDGLKNEIEYSFSEGSAVHAPVLDASRWVYECEVEKIVPTGESDTFFCRIINTQCDDRLSAQDTFHIDLTKLDPIVYSGLYHSIGDRLGQIGDFLEK